MNVSLEKHERPITGGQVTRLWGRSTFMKQALLIFIVAIALNYVWEILQAPLYVGFEDWTSIWWHCFVAALGDGILVWIILVVGWVRFRHFAWYVYPSKRTLAFMLVAGLCIGIGVEWVAVHILSRWTYTANMPIFPKLNVGLVPLLQMLLLPPLIFRIAARWTGTDYMDASNWRSAGR